MGKPYRWTSWNDEHLMEMRLCDLGLRISTDSLIGRCKARLYRELGARRLSFRPNLWISDDWFSPDGVPGFAVPFFLIHPRLRLLTRKQMIEVEGGTEDWCMRLMRHETGHALDNAFGLRRLKRRQSLFGLSSTPYPESYSPKPYSRKYVVNLDSWYAQSHPDEDWAETFAVWLNPRSGWRTRYQKGVARRKLDYLSETMERLAGKASPNKLVETPGHLNEMKITVGEFFRNKRELYTYEGPYFFDRELMRVFSNEQAHLYNGRADRFLRSHRKEIRTKVAKWTGHYQYAVNDIISELIARCEELDLHLRGGPRQAKLDLIAMLSARTAAYLSSGEYEIYL